MSGRVRGFVKRDKPLSWTHATVITVLLVILYFDAPLSETESPLPFWAATLIASVLIVILGVLVYRRMRRLEANPVFADLPTLAMLLVFTMLGFALVYYALARSSPGEVAGLHTRLDSLYFTLSTVTTVGLGDIHPAGQVARGIACVQFAFDAVLLTTLIRKTVAVRQESGSGRREPPDDV